MLGKNAVSRFVIGIIGLVLGLCLVTASSATVISWISRLAGLMLILINIVPAIIGALMKSEGSGRIAYISSVVGVVIGIVLLFLPTAAVSVGVIIAGVYLLVLPIYDICRSSYKAEQFKMELPKLILGAILVILGPFSLLDIAFKIVGWSTVVLSAVELCWAVYDGVKK